MKRDKMNNQSTKTNGEDSTTVTRNLLLNSKHTQRPTPKTGRVTKEYRCTKIRHQKEVRVLLQSFFPKNHCNATIGSIIT